MNRMEQKPRDHQKPFCDTQDYYDQNKSCGCLYKFISYRVNKNKQAIIANRSQAKQENELTQEDKYIKKPTRSEHVHTSYSKQS